MKELKKINVRNLLKEKTPREILTDYMEGKIYLTPKQLQQVIDKKEGVDKGRGSCIIGKSRKKERMWDLLQDYL